MRGAHLHTSPHTRTQACTPAPAPLQANSYVHVTGYNLQFAGGVVREAWICSFDKMEGALDAMHGLDTSDLPSSMLDQLPSCMHSQAVAKLRADKVWPDLTWGGGFAWQVPQGHMKTGNDTRCCS